MLALRHPNGNPVVKIYGPLDAHVRGATLTFKLLKAPGSLVHHDTVEKLRLETPHHCERPSMQVRLFVSLLVFPGAASCGSTPGRPHEPAAELWDNTRGFAPGPPKDSKDKGTKRHDGAEARAAPPESRCASGDPTRDRGGGSQRGSAWSRRASTRPAGTGGLHS